MRPLGRIIIGIEIENNSNTVMFDSDPEFDSDFVINEI
jgi:hypothetical protein